MLRNKSVPTSYSQRWVTMLRKNRKADWTMGEHPPEQFQFVTFYTHFHPIFNSNRMNLVSKNNVCQGLFKHDLHWKVGGHAPEYVLKTILKIVVTIATAVLGVMTGSSFSSQ